MQQIWDRLAGVFKFIGKMLLVDARVELTVVSIAMGLAFLAAHLALFVMTATGVEGGARTDIAYFASIFTLSTILGLASVRPLGTFREKAVARPAALLLGLGLLASRSTWSGIHPNIPELTGPSVLLLIAVCLLAPYCEESFFRGRLWKKLTRTGFNVGLVIVLTSLLYVFPHLPTSFAAFVDYATIGLMLGLVRYFSGGVLMPVLFHVAMNTMVMFKL